MSSSLLFNQTLNSSPHVEIDQTHSDSHKIFHLPVERISQIIKTETQILATFKESLNLQYETFDFKYLTFKQLIDEFMIKTNRDQAQISEIYGFDDNPHVKASKCKYDPMIKHKSDKKQCESLTGSQIDDSFGSFEGLKREKAKIRDKKPKAQKRAQVKQERVKDEPMIQTIERRMRKSVNYEEQDQSSNEQKLQNKMDLKKKFKVLNFYIESRGSNKYEISRQKLEQVIMKRGHIKNHFNKIGEIMLHPYSTLQMLLDYNESSDYPLVKVGKQEAASEDESD